MKRARLISIRLEKTTGCGIASVANIVGKTYAEMKAIANSLDVYAEDKRFGQALKMSELYWYSKNSNVQQVKLYLSLGKCHIIWYCYLLSTIKKMESINIGWFLKGI